MSLRAMRDSEAGMNHHCPHCGLPIPSGSYICPECGKPIVYRDLATSSSSLTVSECK